MNQIEFMSKSIEFGGIKRNFEEHGEINYADAIWMLKTLDKLFDSHSRQVYQEIRLLKELSELKNELGKKEGF